ncbi:hypothetical protein acsn021_17900 [Anaerocolumna cellulosilytica]|uniref:Uncharacterized protein n=1 Tax=Anaerocolumna cellulosilytica TaxID=433286 RepID=A0A6S6R566_9FIRM|nr:AraC family transcriptional regulator [Anaerocolumna cellulosilytica]MBB5194815.1 AraC-like DNA-binding protein [Anaerocolumna cellulosilytica]BCJ94221.1 hypothetical protein acsn021_17900 [Anaerocolumna cellulosilytica]
MNTHTLTLIKKLVFDTIQLDFNYLKDPYTDIFHFDRHLRNSLEHSEILYQQIIERIYSLQHNCFYLMCDNFILNYVIFLPFEHNRDVITLGPYMTNEIDADYLNEIATINHLAYADIEYVKRFLFGIPRFDNSLQLLSIVTDILLYLNPASITFSIVNESLLSRDNEVKELVPKEDFEVYANSVEERYKIEHTILQAIKEGNSRKAMLAGKEFLSRPFEPRIKNNLHDIKAMLFSTNTLFRKAAEDVKIHPIYLHEISCNYAQLIETSLSVRELNKIYEKMIRDYCLLVRNKSMVQYSPTIRPILHYIEFNINSPLTLSELSKKFNLSIPYISSLFKKELNMTVVTHINKLRIREAIKLLNTSSMSIQNIAAYVGILDCNYFTKVFKKEIGCTPSEYRKKTT